MSKNCTLESPVIYKTINLVNGKIYVGKSIYNDPSYLGSGLKLAKAIKKYGREKFDKIIIEECHIDDLDRREVFWINELDAINNDIGYNISIGGTGGPLFLGKTHTNKTKLILKEKATTLLTPEKEKLIDAGRRKFIEGLKENDKLYEQWQIKSQKNRNNYYICVDVINEKIYRIKNLKDFCRQWNINYTSMVTFASYKKNLIDSRWACISGLLDDTTDDIILQNVLEEITNYRKLMDERQIRSWNRDKSNSLNPNAKRYIFEHIDGQKIEFNGNFDRDCREYTGCPIAQMRKLIKNEINEYKGWRYLINE